MIVLAGRHYRYRAAQMLYRQKLYPLNQERMVTRYGVKPDVREAYQRFR